MGQLRGGAGGLASSVGTDLLAPSEPSLQIYTPNTKAALAEPEELWPFSTFAQTTHRLLRDASDLAYLAKADHAVLGRTGIIGLHKSM
jgi:hypothetical protein